VASRGPRHARLDGFALHANVWVADGRILVARKTVWRDGSAYLLFEPIEFVEKLMASIPRPAAGRPLDRSPANRSPVNPPSRRLPHRG
jgi:hypothetical protein